MSKHPRCDVCDREIWGGTKIPKMWHHGGGIMSRWERLDLCYQCWHEFKCYIAKKMRGICAKCGQRTEED